MIDPLVSLAFNIQSKKGVYALLLGSGISRSSGIPTGWEIILDLSTKLAAAMGEDTKGDPERWYVDKFRKEPNYSELLDALCKTPTERQQLLRPYFEPTDEEREQGLKQPTKAHRAIAKLMVAGYIRVAVTINFDRLLEQAIQDEGIAPFVIMSDDSIAGAMPLAHQKCCVVKLHGDYLDTRIKNTPSELSKYEDKTTSFLDQIFDQFGLIVCGWSAQWDIALRASIERCSSHRFTMFWASRGAPSDAAMQLITLRVGEMIPIGDADSFFTKLADMVQGIDQSKTANPASMDSLVAVTKRYLADPKSIINLSDMVHEEVQSARQNVEKHSEQVLSKRGVDDFNKIFAGYRMIVARIQAILIHGCFYGSTETIPLWTEAIQRIAMKDSIFGGSSIKDGIRLYPAVILLYSAGLAAIAKGRIDLVAAILTKPQYRDINGMKMLLLSSVWSEMSEFCKQTTEGESKHVPRSEHLYVVLREPLRRFIPEDDIYDRRFDEWEYLLAMVYMDNEKVYSGMGMPWGPPGRFCWKSLRDKESIMFTSERELDAQQKDWAPVRAGLLGSKPERAKELQSQLATMVSKLGLY